MAKYIDSFDFNTIYQKYIFTSKVSDNFQTQIPQNMNKRDHKVFIKK